MRKTAPTGTPRTKKRSTKRQTVTLTLWVTPQLKAELQRLAAQDGLSVSKTGATFLAEAIRQKLHIQHAVLLQPIIEQAIRKHMNRLVLFLVRIAFDSGQTRCLVTNMLGRQPGINPELFEHLLDASSKTAKGNILYRTPQLATLLDEVEAWLRQEEGHD
jgi:hypothetical protein